MRLISKDKAAGKTVVEFEGSEFVDLLSILRTVSAEYSALDPIILDLTKEQVELVTDAFYAVAKAEQRVPESVA